MKINFSKILTNQNYTLSFVFDNNYWVDIVPNLDYPIREEEFPYRYDILPSGKIDKEIYTLMGFKLIPFQKLYNLSQEQVEDICDVIKSFSPYIRDDIHIAERHIPQSEIENIVSNAIRKLENYLDNER